MAVKKKRTGQELTSASSITKEEASQLAAEQRATKTIKTRPTGAPPELARDITNLSPEQRKREQEISALTGLELRKRQQAAGVSEKLTQIGEAKLTEEERKLLAEMNAPPVAEAPTEEKTLLEKAKGIFEPKQTMERFKAGEITQEQAKAELGGQLKQEAAIIGGTALVGGAILGGGFGGVATAKSGILSKITSIRSVSRLLGLGGLASVATYTRQKTTNEAAKFDVTSQNFKDIIEATKAGLPPSDAIELWNRNQANLRAHEREFKKMSGNIVGNVLYGAFDNLVKVQATQEDLNMVGGLNDQFRAAILNAAMLR